MVDMFKLALSIEDLSWLRSRRFWWGAVRVMFTLLVYRIALAPARKPYRIRLLFTHKNGDFGAISVTERSSAAPTFNMLRHISDRFFATIGAV